MTKPREHRRRRLGAVGEGGFSEEEVSPTPRGKGETELGEGGTVCVVLALEGHFKEKGQNTPPPLV